MNLVAHPSMAVVAGIQDPNLAATLAANLEARRVLSYTAEILARMRQCRLPTSSDFSIGALQD